MPGCPNSGQSPATAIYIALKCPISAIISRFGTGEVVGNCQITSLSEPYGVIGTGAFFGVDRYPLMLFLPAVNTTSSYSM